LPPDIVTTRDEEEAGTIDAQIFPFSAVNLALFAFHSRPLHERRGRKKILLFMLLHFSRIFPVFRERTMKNHYVSLMERFILGNFSKALGCRQSLLPVWLSIWLSLPSLCVTVIICDLIRKCFRQQQASKARKKASYIYIHAAAAIHI